MTRKIKVAIVGVGNCASSLIQGLDYYSGSETAGLISQQIGNYTVSDIEIVAAFDIDERKVGRDISEAIYAEPNCTLRFANVAPKGVRVSRGPTLDGVGEYTRDVFRESLEADEDVTAILRATNAEVVVNYLPVGSEEAARHYAQAAIDAECGFINCMPVFLVSDSEWGEKFNAAGVPALGDDIKSQVGATIVHRVLAELMHDRGVILDRTYQLNFGGNTDFQNMLERSRLKSKKISKTQAVTSIMGVQLPARDVHVGPSDYVPWLDDRKWAQIYLEGRGYGGAPFKAELKLEVHDSPNSAAVVTDAIRYVALAQDRGISGPLLAPSAWLMKSPPEQMPDHIAKLNAEFYASMPLFEEAAE